MHFKKRPIEIQAWQFMTGSAQCRPTPQWLTDAFLDGRVYYHGGDEPYITIKTLEGEMRANIGDWIIQGVKGELYPCKNEIFEATYEASPQALAEGRR